jgi:predicted AAA+ superfamily ATPase
MNDIRSGPERSGLPLLPRLAAGALNHALDAVPVAVIMGARQTGKSTLAEMRGADRPYLTLDDLDTLEQARTAPLDLVRRFPAMTLDEVQREPDLLLAIKRAVDEQKPRSKGRFLLTGSANLLLMERASESLAGRAVYVTLGPLTRRERLGLGQAGNWTELLSTRVEDWYDLVRAGEPEREDWRELVRRGGLPPAAYEIESYESRAVWFRGYVQTYLERDLQNLAAIDNLLDFRRVMRAAALRIGGVVNQAELGRDTAVSRPTVHRYLNLLETSYQIVRIEPYSVNRTKRLIKSPKLYWSDTGVALYLAEGVEPAGAHLENLVLADLLAWRDSLVSRPEVLFWRTAEGEEVDFVVESAGRLLAIEVKATRAPSPRDVRHIRTFREQYPDAFAGGLLLHDGAEVAWMAEDVLAVPWWRVI